MARPLPGHDQPLAGAASSQPGRETTSALIKQRPVTSRSTYGWQFRPPSCTWWPPSHQRWSALAHRHPKTCWRCVCKVGLTFLPLPRRLSVTGRTTLLNYTGAPDAAVRTLRSRYFTASFGALRVESDDASGYKMKDDADSAVEFSRKNDFISTEWSSSDASKN